MAWSSKLFAYQKSKAVIFEFVFCRIQVDSIRWCWFCGHVQNHTKTIPPSLRNLDFVTDCAAAHGITAFAYLNKHIHLLSTSRTGLTKHFLPPVVSVRVIYNALRFLFIFYFSFDFVNFILFFLPNYFILILNHLILNNY